jgi:uncharacterized protein YdhG (YjbR/CyaY superfamily)
MQSSATTVEAYLSDMPEAAAAALSALRQQILRAVPDLQERMSHGMACYFQSETLLFALARQKQNLAFYCCNTETLARHVSALGATSAGKSCVRFKKLSQLDLAAIDVLLKDAARKT